MAHERTIWIAEISTVLMGGDVSCIFSWRENKRRKVRTIIVAAVLTLARACR